MMHNIAFLMQKGNMSFFEVMALPWGVLLSLLKHFQIFELQKTEEGRKLLNEAKILNRSNNLTEPDWSKIRGLKGYQAQRKKQRK